MFFKRTAKQFFFPGLLSLFLLFALSSCNGYSAQNDKDLLLYLGWDDSGKTQLFSSHENGSQKLTALSGGVQDYSASPNGRSLIFSTKNENGETEIWVMESNGSSQKRLYQCANAECANFIWAPDSRQLLFERREFGGDGIPKAPVLWWLDTATAAVRPLQEGGQKRGANAQISPDGQWLSYFSPEEEGLFIYNFASGASHFITNEIGADVAWSPDSRYFVVPQLDLIVLHGEEGDDHQSHEHDYQTAVHLLRLDLESREQEIISGDLPVEDSVPAWSPDGEWIAFGRRAPGTGAPRQIWIMRPDGTEVKALTDDPAVNHGPPIWVGDGRTLIFQQLPQEDLSSDPSIWRIDIETGEKKELVPSGMHPSWLHAPG